MNDTGKTKDDVDRRCVECKRRPNKSAEFLFLRPGKRAEYDEAWLCGKPKKCAPLYNEVEA